MSHNVIRLLPAEEILRRLFEIKSDQMTEEYLYPLIVQAAADQEKCVEGLFLCVIHPILQLRRKGGYFLYYFDMMMMLVPAWIRCLTDDEVFIEEAIRLWHAPPA